jgi:uncharacterized membrane protein
MNLILLCFLIGCVAGLRAFTAPAAICWGAHFGWLHFAGTKLWWIDHPVTLVLVTLAAIGELVNDKLPTTPARTVPANLIPRILFGGFSGAALAVSANGNVPVAAVAGVIGALAGTLGGYHARRALVARAGLPDFAVALVEDLIAVGGGLLIVSHL